jgi:hypothetical protein
MTDVQLEDLQFFWGLILYCGVLTRKELSHDQVQKQSIRP